MRNLAGIREEKASTSECSRKKRRGFHPVECISTAAIEVDGEVWTLPRPARHHVLIRAWCMSHYKDGKDARIPDGYEPGFVTDYGRFVDTEEAARIAFKAGQIDEEKRILFSEDLW